MIAVLLIVLSYLTIGTIAGRYTWREAKRFGREGKNEWAPDSSVNFWVPLVFWPITIPLVYSQAMRDRGKAPWIMCAREPKKVREAEKLKRLERDLDL